MCVNDFRPITLMPPSILAILRALNFIIAFLNILGNGFLIYALKKTGQTKTISIKFIIIMSVSDLLTGIIGMFLISFLFWEEFYNYCSLQVAARFSISITTSFSIAMIALVALDRYFHMKYLERYPTIITKQRSYCLTLGCLCMCVAFNASRYLSMNGSIIPETVSVLLWIPMFISIACLYYSAYRKLQMKASSQINQIVRSALHEGKKFAKTGKLVVISIGLLTMPLYIYRALQQIMKHNSFMQSVSIDIYTWLANLLLFSNAFSSSIIFITQNRAVMNVLKGFLTRNRIQSNIVTET